MIKFKYAAILISLLLVVSCNKDSNDNNSGSLAGVILGQIEVTSSTSASVDGMITNDGGSAISAKGVAWSTSTSPTIVDNSTNEGSGSGDFISTLSNLVPGETYYVRAYATNSAGTSYSPEMSFEAVGACDQNAVTEQVFLTTQQEINDFGAQNVCKIANDLFIREETGTSDPIVDLTPLSSLEIIEGRLYLQQLSQLVDLNGLENLSQALDGLYITQTTSLINVDALSNLTSEVTELVISQNQSLQNLDGLSGLTTFVDSQFGEDPQISIAFNSSLQSIDGLSNVTRLGEGDASAFGLLNNPLVQSISIVSGFSQDVDRILISGNFTLWDISALQGVTSCREFILVYNGFISDYSSLQNLTSVSSDMEISGTGLDNLDMLQNLISVGGDLKFADNSSLFDYCGLQNLIDANGLQGNFITQNNAYNPTYQDMLNGDCSF